MSEVVKVFLLALLDALLSRGRAYFERKRLKEAKRKLAREVVENGDETSRRFRERN